MDQIGLPAGLTAWVFFPGPTVSAVAPFVGLAEAGAEPGQQAGIRFPKAPFSFRPIGPGSPAYGLRGLPR
jgi:hypothetical protein